MLFGLGGVETPFPPGEFFRNLKKACDAPSSKYAISTHFAFGHGGGTVPAPGGRRLRSGPVERGKSSLRMLVGREGGMFPSTPGGTAINSFARGEDEAGDGVAICRVWVREDSKSFQRMWPKFIEPLPAERPRWVLRMPGGSMCRAGGQATDRVLGMRQAFAVGRPRSTGERQRRTRN